MHSCLILNMYTCVENVWVRNDPPHKDRLLQSLFSLFFFVTGLSIKDYWRVFQCILVALLNPLADSICWNVSLSRASDRDTDSITKENPQADTMVSFPTELNSISFSSARGEWSPEWESKTLSIQWRKSSSATLEEKNHPIPSLSAEAAWWCNRPASSSLWLSNISVNCILISMKIKCELITSFHLYMRGAGTHIHV